MARHALIRRPPSELKRFPIAISLEAHKRLREAANRFGIGQDHILTVLLERVDWNTIAKPLEELKREAMAKQVQAKLKAEDVETYLATLSPSERAAVLKRVKAK